MATSWLEEVVLEDLEVRWGLLYLQNLGVFVLMEKWDLRGTLLSMGVAISADGCNLSYEPPFLIP